MKKELILIFLAGFLLLGAEKPRLARLHYDGGGDWYNDQDIIPNLVEYLNETIKTDFSPEQDVVRPGETKLFDYPFIFMTGHGNIKFTDKEIASLREYLVRGGFLYADDDYGMDPSFRAEISKIFPDIEMVELPPGHDLFHCYFNFPEGIPKIHKHDDKRPQAFAVFSPEGRMLMLYTYETNISDGWSDVHNDPQQLREQAFRMGANLFFYLMSW